MRSGIPSQQRHLEKQQARGPHRRRPAEPRQNRFGDERLDLKQQECAEKDRNSEQIPGFGCRLAAGRRKF